MQDEVLCGTVGQHKLVQGLVHETTIVLYNNNRTPSQWSFEAGFTHTLIKLLTD